MLDFKALNDRTYFITNTQGIQQFHKLEATADGIRLYVKSEGNVKVIDYGDISYIIAENKCEYFGVADNFIEFIKADLAEMPLLFDLILALWNKNYYRAGIILDENNGITKNFIGYMQTIATPREFNTVLFAIFANYLSLKNNKPI